MTDGDQLVEWFTQALAGGAYLYQSRQLVRPEHETIPATTPEYARTLALRMRIKINMLTNEVEGLKLKNAAMTDALIESRRTYDEAGS